MNLPLKQQARLQHLAQAVLSTSAQLQVTDRGVFAQPFTVERASGLGGDAALMACVDAAVVRFACLQGTECDKFVLALLQALQEPCTAVIDSLDRAERLGWIAFVDAWIETRCLSFCTRSSEELCTYS